MKPNDAEFELPQYPLSVEAARQSFLAAIVRYNTDVLTSLGSAPYQEYRCTNFAGLLKNHLINNQASASVFPSYELLIRGAKRDKKLEALKDVMFGWAQHWNLLYRYDGKSYAHWIIEQALWTMTVWSADEAQLTNRQSLLRPVPPQKHPTTWPYYLMEVWPESARFPALRFAAQGWNPLRERRSSYAAKVKRDFKVEMEAYMDSISTQADKMGLVQSKQTRDREAHFDRRIVWFVLYQLSGLGRDLLAATERVSVDTVRKSLTAIAKLLDVKLRNPGVRN